MVQSSTEHFISSRVENARTELGAISVHLRVITFQKTKKEFRINNEKKMMTTLKRRELLFKSNWQRLRKLKRSLNRKHSLWKTSSNQMT